MSGKRSFSELQGTCVRRPKEESVPYKKKRKNLVDLFNRASIAVNPDECTKVYLRVKPLTGDEECSQKCLNVISEENAVQATAPDSSHAHKSSTRGLGKSSLKFTFSQVFDENTRQADFFNHTMLDMTKEFIGGQNSLIFCYGVTSSGKTYTIQGKPQDAGILPRSLDVLFNSINGKQISNPSLKPEMFNDFVKLSADEVLEEKKLKKQTLKLGANDDPTVMSLMGDEMESALSDTAMSSSSGIDELLADVVNRDREKIKVDVEEKVRFGVWVSFAEVYNEQVYDLLVPVPQKKKGKRETLRISDDRNGNPYIKGLKEIHVESADEAYKLLTIGQRNLMTACTRLNHCSSRSHSIFNIKILRVVNKEDPHIACVSTLSLCDLAGAERYSKTQASGDRLREAGNINASLMTLGRCIETLRHNQLHRDQQRLVPFRDSKLTRILQNFFNGYGKAAMIVNVSQAASMFDDTLHVFKFSAIAKQVKYEKAPEEKKTQRVKKVLPPLHRQTIAWESQESNAMLQEAQNIPLPHDEDDIAEEGDEELNDRDEMRKYIEFLEDRNKNLYEMLAEEIQNAQNNENRIRKEAYESMQKQMVIIEESYSTMWKDAVVDAEELADERARGIMEVYEKRLERIQTKVDEDDEWVSSMLYHQEKTKVEEKEAKIAELEKQLQEKQPPVNDSVDMGNTVLVETLTHKLHEAKDEISSKEAQVNELKLLVEEAGETYTNHVEEIKTLNEKLAKEQKTAQCLMQKVSELENLLSDTKQDVCKAQETLDIKEKEWLMSQEDFLDQLKSKDSAISSLEEECKELQGEIERLQDQMSQIDEQSRCQRDLDSSTVSEKNLKLKGNLSIIENSLNGESKLKIGKENICDLDVLSKAKQQNAELSYQLTSVKNELDSRQTDITNLKMQNVTLESNLAEVTKKLHDIEDKYEKMALAGNDDGAAMEITHMVKVIEEKKTSGKGQNEDDDDEDEEIVFNIKSDSKNDKSKTNQSQLKTPSKTETKVDDLAVKLKDAELANIALRNKLKHEEDDYFKREQALIHGYTAEIDSLKLELAKVKAKTDGVTIAKPQRGKKRALMDVSTCSSVLDSESLEEKHSSHPRLDSMIKHQDKDPGMAVLSNEVALLQEQLVSLTSAYKILAKQDKTSVDISVKQKMEPVKKAARQSDVSSVSRYSLTNSVLLFEKEEYAIKFEEMSNRVVELETVVKTLTEQLEKQKETSEEARQQDATSKQECDLSKTNEQVQMLTKELVDAREARNQMKQTLNTAVSARDKLEYEFKEKEEMISQLEENIKQTNEQVHTLTKELADAHEVNNQIKQTLNTAVTAKDNLDCEFSEQEKIVSQLEERIKQKNEQVESLTKELADAREVNSQIQQTLIMTVTAKDKIECEFKEKDQLASQLEERIKQTNDMKCELEKATELSSQKTQDLNFEIENLSQKLAESTNERDLIVGDLQELKNKLNLMAAQLETAKEEKYAYDKEREEKMTQLEICREKSALMEQNFEANKQELAKKDSQSKMLVDKCKDLEQSLLEKEKNFKRIEEDYCQRLGTLEEQLNLDCKTKSTALSSLQEQISKISSQLKEKSEELARVESLRQEEAAEVAQKLIMLEKQKKMLERRAIEACDREEESQLKLQGYETLKEDVEKMRKDLQAQNLRVNEEKTLNIQLQEKLALITEEKQDVESLKSNLSEMELALDNASKAKDHAIIAREQLLEKVEELRVELLESEKTMDKQEEVLTKQDEEIKDLKTALDSSKTECNDLDKALTRKDLEIANLNKQIRKCEEEINTMRQSERRLWEAEQRDKVAHEKLLESSSNNSALQAKVEVLEKEKIALERNYEKKEKDFMNEKDKLRQCLEKAELELEQHICESQVLAEKMKSITEELTMTKSEKRKIEMNSKDLEVELEQLKNKISKISNEAKDTNEIKFQNDHLQEEAEKTKQDLKKAQQELKDMETRLMQISENKKVIEKDLQKQENINKRNKEEMEHWKAERDSCVKKLEHCINKMAQEKEHLNEEVEKLKKSNADLAQEATNISRRKDALISELKKSNNTMSIQLADAEGMTPPPKMATPEQAFPGLLNFEEDIDTSGHLEIDVTPRAAKRGKKRQTTHRHQPSSSSVDPEAIPEPKCLKTIKEESESPFSPSSKSPRIRVAELASEVIATLSPLTRSSAKKLSTRNKGKKSAVQQPLETESETYGAPVDDISTMSTRRSSRLKKTASKHSLV
ncbi:hypothetical protein RRG08_019550 [Elysia crispata]|uniref:Kinesin motor domain-containing protein n=1 Tax=Elysia crispata TaxID=231223 RepID=A0AAE1D623_9GAST|nr:hypothetical protein RRG08_019550 [Elysia crispata]